VRAADEANAGAIAVRVVDARGAQIGPNAKIEFIAPRVDDATGTVAVRAVLDNTGMVLRPGRVVRAHVDGVSVATSLVIPKRAVLHGAQGVFVWVVGDGERVAARPVELGASSGNDVVVSTGLAAGERVVVDGILKVQPGAPVHPTPLAADANTGAAAGGGAPPGPANPAPGSP
jgi:membrane fusion protein (multidrug efflux system)